MKKTKCIIAMLLFTLLVCNSVIAQVYHPGDIGKQIKNSPFILGGHFIANSDRSYYANQDSSICTSSLFQVDKIFKGGIKCGTVELIFAGGQIGNKGQTFFDGPVAFDSGIIFCDSSSWTSMRRSKENPTGLGLDIMIGMQQNKISFGGYTTIFSWQAIYDSFKNVLGHGFSSCQSLGETLNHSSITSSFDNHAIHIQSNNAAVNTNASKSILNHEIGVSPNPVIELANIEAPDSIDYYFVVIYDDSGKTVYSRENISIFKLKNINFKFLKRGAYTGMAISGLNIYNFKFIKE